MAGAGGAGGGSEDGGRGTMDAGLDAVVPSVAAPADDAG